MLKLSTALKLTCHAVNQKAILSDVPFGGMGLGNSTNIVHHFLIFNQLNN